jgi:aminoglycoside 3-N-acetyltransferase I
VAVLRGLNAASADALAEQGTYNANPPSDAYLRWLLSKAQVGVFVPDVDGAAVEGLTISLLDKPEQVRAEVCIHDLAVAGSHRRRGIARALIAAACDRAGAQVAWVVHVQADRGDDPAIGLHISLGTREDVLHFDLPVPSRDGP